MTDSKLPTDPATRKTIPIATGFIDYFPDAIAAVAELSQIGNEQHNPGAPLHWDRSKSGDESDALMRHFLERGTIDSDGVRHSAKVAWRALALLQKEIEAARTGDRRPAGAIDWQQAHREGVEATIRLSNSSGQIRAHNEDMARLRND